MKILVINCGSSSIKYQLFAMPSPQAVGLCERIGETGARLKQDWQGRAGRREQIDRAILAADHREAFAHILTALEETGLVARERDLGAIGHRVVHGGEDFSAPTLIDAGVVERIRSLIPLAPLHNPANLTGIQVCLEAFPQVPQVAVFDTAFHQSMPPQAYRYALPSHWYRDYGVRRYGFHGTSHAFVAQRAADSLGRPLDELDLISLHLGNGVSAAAIKGGRCVDTSMGLTPLEGLVMGTRCGDIDPAIIFYLQQRTGMSGHEVEVQLNTLSGLKGLCGINDMREILGRAQGGDQPAELAVSLFCYRIRKYIGAYAAVLGRLEALIFTAGIGEHSPEIRRRVCADLDLLGIDLNEELNARPGEGVRELQSATSRVRVLVVPTNEELAIAQQTLRLVEGA